MTQQLGFDPKSFNPTRHLLRAPPKPDPWSRSEVWRYTGPFTRYNRFKGAFPGFGIATAAFTVYCVYELLFLRQEHHHGVVESH